MKVISEFYSEDGVLKSTLFDDNGVGTVKFYKNDKLLETCTYPYHTVQYAEDAAENYVLGIKKL